MTVYARAGGGVYWHILVDGLALCGFRPSGKGAKTRGRWAAETSVRPYWNLIHPQCSTLNETRSDDEALEFGDHMAKAIEGWIAAASSGDPQFAFITTGDVMMVEEYRRLRGLSRGGLTDGPRNDAGDVGTTVVEREPPTSREGQ